MLGLAGRVAITCISADGRLGHADHPLCDFSVVLDEVVEVHFDVLGGAADGAHGVAVVAVVEEDGGVLLQRGELLWGAGAAAVEGLAVSDGEVLVPAANYGAEGGCGDDCG